MIEESMNYSAILDEFYPVMIEIETAHQQVKFTENYQETLTTNGKRGKVSRQHRRCWNSLKMATGRVWDLVMQLNWRMYDHAPETHSPTDILDRHQ